MSWLHAHRYELARRLSQAGILLLFWLGAHLHPRQGLDVQRIRVMAGRLQRVEQLGYETGVAVVIDHLVPNRFHPTSLWRRGHGREFDSRPATRWGAVGPEDVSLTGGVSSGVEALLFEPVVSSVGGSPIGGGWFYRRRSRHSAA